MQSSRRIFFAWKLIFGRGLSNIAELYRVESIAADGSVRKRDFAFDPLGGAALANSGLKRFANGVWFDAI